MGWFKRVFWLGNHMKHHETSIFGRIMMATVKYDGQMWSCMGNYNEAERPTASNEIGMVDHRVPFWLVSRPVMVGWFRATTVHVLFGSGMIWPYRAVSFLFYQAAYHSYHDCQFSA